MLPTDDVAGAVGRLGARLRRPVVTALSVKGHWELPGEVSPSVYSEDRLSLSLRAASGNPGDIQISGTGPDGSPVHFRFQLLDRKEPAIRQLWASQRIQSLLGQGNRAAAIELGRRHNLICEGAAFVAWDEAEKVPIASREIYQPSIETQKECFEFRSAFSAPRRSNRAASDGTSPDSMCLPLCECQPLTSFQRSAELFKVALAIPHLRGGDQIIDFLTRWRNQDPRKEVRRDESFARLVDALCVASIDNRSASIDVFREWIQNDFKNEGGDVKKLLKLLEKCLRFVEGSDQAEKQRQQSPPDSLPRRFWRMLTADRK